MAKPRLFISSTFYDLKHVRYDLENFTKSMGYEPIMNDKGNIPYLAEQPLENSCYDEVARCDILIGIIGNNYGTSSKQDNDYSISMQEIKTAIKNNKQVFIFVEKAVLNENKLYLKNKNNSDITYVAVNNIKIHKFIEEITTLPMNNAIIPFESATEITYYLKEQFAGLFQRLLQERATVTERTTYYDLKETINEFKNIVKDIDVEKQIFLEKFEGSIFALNWCVQFIRKKVGMKNAVIFAKNKDSLFEILEHMCFIREENEDDIFDENFIFKKTINSKIMKLIISRDIFNDDDTIKDIRKVQELENLMKYEEEEIEEIEEIDDEEIPF